MKKTIGLVILAAMLGCNSNKPKSSEKLELEVNIKLKKNEFKVNESILVSFLVKNNSDENKKFCIRQTPLEGQLTANIFEIECQGKILEYEGIIIKRGEPQVTDSVSLAPKGFLEKEIIINQSYDLKNSAHYKIRFLGRPINGLPDSGFIDFTIN